MLNIRKILNARREADEDGGKQARKTVEEEEGKLVENNCEVLGDVGVSRGEEGI